MRERLAEADRAYAERRSLAAAILLAQEQERRRVAEELHDGPVQELVGLGLTLDALSAELRADAPHAADGVARAAASARDSVKALRRAIFDLHPMALEELGFAAATRALVQRLKWRGARVSLDLAAADALSETHRTVAFRVVQEAVAIVVPRPGVDEIATSPPASAARSLIAARPRWPPSMRGRARLGSKPRPSSVTSMTMRPPSCRAVMATRVGSAWRTTFATAS